MVADVFELLNEGMKSTMHNLGRDLAKVRTGRANPALIEGLKADYYGVITPINQMATISVPEARLIVVAPWDAKAISGIEKALQKADLGLNPVNDGKVIRIPFPPLTEERRKDLVKLIKKMGEECKITVRKERRDANELLKELEKDKAISEDDLHRSQDKVQKVHDEYIKKVDEMVVNKEKDVMEV
jgi:ribosome recycling factor